MTPSLFLLPLSLLAYYAVAQSSTPASFPAAASSTITTHLNTTTATWPVATIFLPIDVPPRLAASIITAVSHLSSSTSTRTFPEFGSDDLIRSDIQGPDRTAYAIGCLQHYSIPDTDSDCDFGTSFVLTEGVSTMIYTLTYSDDRSVESTGGATINCVLRGGTRATAATCTGVSVIQGLGTVASTSTLASTQLSYAPITITAGAVKLWTGTEGAQQTSRSSSSSGGAVAVVTAAADVRWMAGGLALGAVGMVGIL